MNSSPTNPAGPQPHGSAPAAMPAQIIVPATRSRLSRTMSWLGWMIVVFCLVSMMGMAAALHDYFDTTGGIREKYHSKSKTATDKIAVIRVTGAIMEGDGYVKRQIDRVRDDDNVKGVVVRVNSPGGTVTGSDYIYHHLTKLRDEKELPMVVSMGALAASGGYYVAMVVGDTEDAIFAEPTTTTGSIGVIVPHYDLSGLMERLDIKNDAIVSHPRKQLLSMTRKASPEDRAILQQYVDTSFARFKEIVKSGRPKFRDDPGKLDELATGEIFTAQRAQETGLVDKIGFIEAAIDRVIKLAELDADNVRVVTYPRQATLIDALGISGVQSPPSLEAQLAKLAVPRAYFLYSRLPILAGSGAR